MSKEIFGEETWAKVESVIKEKGLNLILDNKEKPEYIPKNRFDEVIGQKNLIKTQADELNQQLDILKKNAKGNDELTKTIEELQKKNGDWENRYKSTVLDAAIKLSAVKSKAKDANDIMAFIDRSKLELNEDGTIKGLDEQIKTLAESKPYLFGQDVPSSGGTNPSSGGSKTEIQQLEDQLQEAIKGGKTALMVALKNKIFQLKK